MEIPKLPWDSTDVIDFIQKDRPVVLLNCPLCTPNQGRWTIDYLSSIISPSFKCDVFTSDSCRFQYFDDTKNKTYKKFVQPTEKISVSFQDFSQNLRDSVSALQEENGTYKRFYLQQSMVAEMGPAMMDEYMRFSLEAALKFKLAGKWDAFTTNLLLIGSQGVITPCHFDEQQNLFAQLNGYKRVRLFPPSAWTRLYPFPLNHACDRQTRVVLPKDPGSCILDLEMDRERFPAFADCSEDNMEYFVDLAPGEVLYIPQYWFHQMESLTENTSLSWWFKHQTKHAGKAQIDMSTISTVAVRRNLERLIGDSVGGGRSAHDFFLAIAAGKIPIPTEVPPLAQGGEAIVVVSSSGAAPQRSSPRPVLPPIGVDIAAAADLTPNPQWEDIVKQAVAISSLVLPPGESPAFISELVSGRFSGLEV